MKKLLKILLSISIVLAPTPLCAWSEGGHHIITLLAFDLLEPVEKSQLLSILDKHPRFVEDFAPPPNLPNENEVTRWRVGRIGYWPDVARRQPTFHRSTWHYELGHSLVIGEASKMNVPARPGPLPSNATLQTQDLYISQALDLCTQVLSDSAQPDPDRAVALCWIAHLVADAHQPCHAGSLYMEKVFVEQDGDRGANSILTKQKKNMHALWDQLLGPDFNLSDVRRRMVEIGSNPELVEKGKLAVSIEAGLDPQTWLAESRSAAIEHVYRQEVLDSLNLVARGLLKKPEAIDLSEEYLKNAGRVAQSRAIEASYRLAKTWKIGLADAAKNPSK